MSAAWPTELKPFLWRPCDHDCVI